MAEGLQNFAIKKDSGSSFSRGEHKSGNAVLWTSYIHREVKLHLQARDILDSSTARDMGQ